jgi:hypothetical protein
VPLTVDDLAHHLNMQQVPAAGSRDRVELQRALDAAVQEVTRATGMPDAATTTVTVVADPGDRVLLLPYVRVASVGAVVDPGGVAVAPSSVDVRAGLVTLPTPSSGGAWTVQVTGTPWPAALATAALDWATHMYDTQRTVTSPVSDPDTPAPAFALPNRVEELLRPYRLAGIA